MKEWSRKWKGSKIPKKQRKYVHKAPLHVRGSFLSAHLTKELRQKYHTRSLRLRKGDRVKIVRGSFKGKQGKVERVDTKKLRIYIEGAVMTKRDGTKTSYPLHASNVLITDIETGDKRRLSEGKPL